MYLYAELFACVVVPAMWKCIKNNSIGAWGVRWLCEVCPVWSSKCDKMTSESNKQTLSLRKGKMNGTMPIKYACKYNQLKIWQEQQQHQCTRTQTNYSIWYGVISVFAAVRHLRAKSVWQSDMAIFTISKFTIISSVAGWLFSTVYLLHCRCIQHLVVSVPLHVSQIE